MQHYQHRHRLWWKNRTTPHIHQLYSFCKVIIIIGTSYSMRDEGGSSSRNFYAATQSDNNPSFFLPTSEIKSSNNISITRCKFSLINSLITKQCNRQTQMIIIIKRWVLLHSTIHLEQVSVKSKDALVSLLVSRSLIVVIITQFCQR